MPYAWLIIGLDWSRNITRRKKEFQEQDGKDFRFEQMVIPFAFIYG
jgi:hypothetical protein